MAATEDRLKLICNLTTLRSFLSSACPILQYRVEILESPSFADKRALVVVLLNTDQANRWRLLNLTTADICDIVNDYIKERTFVHREQILHSAYWALDEELQERLLDGEDTSSVIYDSAAADHAASSIRVSIIRTLEAGPLCMMSFLRECICEWLQPFFSMFSKIPIFA
eukprot:ANDGO_01278.mRNA.1 hypothetical protein